jgi:HD-GYP domain-containing protein (c-di-GMP phosphodiesterase class II)
MSITRAQPEPAGTPSTEESVLKGMRLLIVDDLAFNVALMRGLLREAEHRGDVLDEAVRARTVELEQARLESLTILASVTEYHDDDTHRHTRRVGATAALLARGLGLPEPFVAGMRAAAPLNDIGKVGIPNEILLKPGPLTDEERAAMMQHVAIGPKMLAAACSPILRLAAEIAGTHHERWDGTGYLRGLAGEEIPMSGRVTAVATSSMRSPTPGPTRRPGTTVRRWRRSRPRPGGSSTRGWSTRCSGSTSTSSTRSPHSSPILTASRPAR